VAAARRWRKMLGGGMRQAGVLAAAGIVALSDHVERLAEDHENARKLARGLAEVAGIDVDHAAVQTNMVFVRVAEPVVEPLSRFLKERGILVAGRGRLRLVTHLDITADDVSAVVAAFREYFGRAPL